MHPRGGRVWAWVFPMAAFFGGFMLTTKGAGGPYTLAFDLSCIVVGLAGTVFLFNLGTDPKAKGKSGLSCEVCGKKPPAIRKPANFKQMLWGGWTCKGCGADLDSRGREIG